MNSSSVLSAPEALIVAPDFMPRLWGSRNLRPYFPDPDPSAEPVGEAWLTADRCRLAAAPARSLADLIAERGPELFGAAQRAAFPVLVKLLFPSAYLSVQVHPTDDYARRHRLGSGKTEMWHVLRAEPGARVGFNLIPGASLADFATACRAGRSRELLQWWDAAPGDSFFVPAGTIHALGPGLVLCEVQQPSDVTFRLDDFGRRDAVGRLRELHLERGLAVAQPRTAATRVPRQPAGQGGLLVVCEFFRVERRVIAGELALDAGFRVLVLLAGAVALAPAGAAPSPLPLAHAAVLPASAGPWRLAGSGEVLDVTLPA